MNSMLVIGLGRFGTHLAKKLTELHNEVMVVDKNEAAVTKIADFVTRAQIGDCMEPGVIQTLGVRNFDVCFVCISNDFQSSLEITSLLKEFGAPCVIAKADREIHAKFLRKVGADDIVYPERDMAQRAAVKYSIKNAFEYIELTPEYAIFEMLVPESWVGKTIKDLDVRSKHNINVIGFKKDGIVKPITDPNHYITKNEHLIVAGSKKDILNITQKK